VIDEFNTTGTFDLIAGRDVSQTSNSILTGTGEVLIESGRNIDLQNQNGLSGLVSFNAANDINFSNSVDTRLGDVSTQNLSLDINGNISDEGNIIVSDTTSINANGNQVTLDSVGNDFNIVNVDSASTLILNDLGVLTLNNVNVSESVAINAEGLTIAQAFNANNISLNASAVMEINADLITNSGDLLINAGSLIQNASLTSAANIYVQADQNISMDAASISSTSNGSITYEAGGNIELAELNAIQGTVRIETVAGEIVDANADVDNIVANRAELITQNGIGEANALETQISVLFAENEQGAINLNNRGNILLERLATLGDIQLLNANMDGSDITFMAGSVDAGYDVGSILMTTEGGSFLGHGETPDFDNADIVAREARFVDSQLLGDFGSVSRPLVLRVRDYVLIAVRTIVNPLFADPQPEIDTSESLIHLNAFDTISSIIGGQFVVVEELEDVDPAIFTDVRNYNHDDVAVKLPRDQRYDEEEEEALLSAGGK